MLASTVTPLGWFVIASYASIGIIVGFCFGVHQAREFARNPNLDDINPSGAFVIGLIGWGLGAIVGLIYCGHVVITKAIEAVAQTDKLPEVKERRRREMEKQIIRLETETVDADDAYLLPSLPKKP